MKSVFSKNTSSSLTFSLILILSTVVSSCKLINRKYYTNPTACFEEAKAHTPYDALIVTGFPHHKDSMSFVVQDRVLWASYLYNNGFVKNIIFSGSAVYTPYVEAKVMALYAEQLGIPQAHIFVENQAEHSSENLYYSYRLAQKNGFKSIALGTEVAQSSFIKSINDHRFKLQVDFIPIVYDTLNTLAKPESKINDESAFISNFVPLTDRENIFKRLSGTRGKKVKKMMKAERRLLRIQKSTKHSIL